MSLYASLFDNTFDGADFAPQSAQQAYISILYAVAKSDGNFGDEEMQPLISMIMLLGIFSSSDVHGLIASAEENLSSYGYKAIIDGSINFIDKKSRPRLFCFCAELVLADGLVTSEEDKVLEYLAGICGVDQETATKIIEVTMIRSGLNL